MRYDFMTLLTATPMPNGFPDLFTQIDFIDPKKRLGRNITQYRSNFFNAVNFSSFTKYEITKENEKKILDLIKPITYRIPKSQKIKVTYINRSFKMSGEYEKKYQKLKKDLVLFLNNIDESDPLMVKSGAAKTNKLLQFCNGFVYDENKKAHQINSQKTFHLKKLVNSLQPQKIIIAYYFKYDLEILKRIYPNAKVLDKNKKSTIEKWNNKKIDILLVHPQSAGHGLNLQFGGHTIIWWGFNHSLLYYQQMNGRVARQGQTEPVEIFHLTNEGKLDNFVLNILHQKGYKQEKFLEYLKKHLA